MAEPYAVSHAGASADRLSRRAAPVVALVAAFYLVAVPIRLHQHGALWFAHIGAEFLHSAHTSSTIDSIHSTESPFGYDGQFYFFIAADPAHARDYMFVGTEDQSGVRYARILYPAVSRALSGGSLSALPAVMLAVNLAAVLVAVWAVALWLRRRGRSPWYAALLGLWPGLVFSVFRDLSEPLAYCLAALAVLAFDERSGRRLALSAGLLALSLLTRETTIGFVLGLALVLALHDRRWRRPLGFLALSVLPMVVWRAAVTAWLGVTTLENAHSGAKLLLPFYGIYARYPWDVQHRLLVATVYVPFLLCALGALVLLHRRRHVQAAVLLLLNVALFVVWIPWNVTIDWGALTRNATPALLAALYCVPAVRSRALTLAGAALLSPLWYLAVASALGFPGLQFMTK